MLRLHTAIALVAAYVLPGCAVIGTQARIDDCRQVRRDAPDPAQQALHRQEIAKLVAASSASTERLLEKADRLAGLNKPLASEYDFTPEPALRKSLELRERMGRTAEPAYARALYRSGVLQWARGRSDAAEQTLLTCRAAAEQSQGRISAEYADCQHWLGVVYNELGRYAEAEQSLRSAADVRERLFGARDPGYAYALFTLGSVYNALGDFAQSEALNVRVLQIREAAFGRCGRLVADSLNNLGYIYRHTDRAEQAVPVYERALEIRSAWLGKEDSLVAQTMNNLGLALSDLGRHDAARALLERSLAMRERDLGPYHQRTTMSVWNLVESAQIAGRLDEVGPLLERGVRGAIDSGDPKLAWRFYDALRAYHRQRGQPDIAIFFGKQAVNTIQGVRARLTQLESRLQRVFVESRTGIYKSLADVLIEEGRLAEAQQVLAMLKEDELFDFMRSGGDDVRKTQASYTGAEIDLNAEFDKVRSQLAAVGAELEALAIKARAGLSDVEKARRNELEALRDVGQQAFDRFLAQVMKKLTATASVERNREVAQRNLGDLQALQRTLSLLGRGAVTLHYLVLEDKTHIILTTPQIQLVRESPIKRADLNRLIQTFRNVVQSTELDPLPLAHELYRIIFQPIEDDLEQAGAQTLMVSLDGTLRYLPLAALHDGKRFMAERYAFALYTEAAKDRLRDPPARQWRFTGLGLTREVQGFTPLPAVREELEGIIKSGALEGEVYFDAEFNAEQFRAMLDRGTPVVHIASHFKFQPGTEADSFLLLGDGSRLSLEKLRGYRFRDVDLITLSACDTAVGGGKDSNGREIEGFGALAQRQGANSVLATLWPVADRSTGHFMQALYKIRQSRSDVTKAEALRQTQLRFIRGEDALRPYMHPYYWAPFILMGNWL